MKKTDFDSIKEKFDNSGVNAPDALHEDRIAGMLPEQPLQALPPKQRRADGGGQKDTEYPQTQQHRSKGLDLR